MPRIVKVYPHAEASGLVRIFLILVLANGLNGESRCGKDQSKADVA
ncbi:hypothetical protein OFY17_11835 [Marinomonas sp. C2222]|uniref:Uncharacterized protein n=1 Tax=Marinomonas sargassi TaxID=2984494 RepID=A0ABT2YUH7_9GAMM|nr:hypothetical protein [Marinomonas sargassi]MCV2403562.1 hypothetical protein [Marinomonas sargassi]